MAPGYLLILLISLAYRTSGKELHPNFTARSWPNVAQTVTTAAPTSRSFFSSRLEYSNKWLPVGRGDPLNNDPTYDYSPPAVDHRVHYWDEKLTKTSGNKNEILLLGVSSRRQYNQNYDRRPSDIREQISTVMLPPPMQPVQKVNFKTEKGSSRQPLYGAHKTWQENAVDTVPAGSNVQSTIVFPNTAHQALYNHRLNANADDVNQLLSHSDFHSPMYVKTNQSKKSWLQDLLQKEVAQPTVPSYVQMEAHTVLKLDDLNHFNSKMPDASQTEIAPAYFLPTIQPAIGTENKLLFKEIPKPMSPMNLIIQGHSRVKTYGQGTEERDPKIIEVKSAENPVVNRVVSQDENGIQFDVKHLHASSDNNKTLNASVNSTAGTENSPVAGLLSLLDLSFGDFLDASPYVANQTKLNEIKAV